jgi:hypothetical protein
MLSPAGPFRHSEDDMPDGRLSVSDARFVALWNAAPDLASAAWAVGVTVALATNRATKLRALGHRLKRMVPTWPRQGSKAAEVLRLCRLGVAPDDIAVRIGCTREFVRGVVARASVERPAVPRRRKKQ